MNSELTEFKQQPDWAMFYDVDATADKESTTETTAVIETDPNFVQETTLTNDTTDNITSMSVEFNESNKALGLNPDTMEPEQSAPSAYSAIVSKNNDAASVGWSMIASSDASVDILLGSNKSLTTNNSLGMGPVNCGIVKMTSLRQTCKPSPTEDDIYKSVMRNRKNASRHRALNKEKLEYQELTINSLRVDNDTKDTKINELLDLLEKEKKIVTSLRNTTWGRVA